MRAAATNPDQRSEMKAAAFNQVMAAGKQESDAALQAAQTGQATQATESAKQIQNIQTEMLSPTITPARKAQLAETLHGLKGSGDVWTPYQAKDAMGMPTGDVTMYNRATGEVRAMPKTSEEASTRAIGTTSTVNGKTAKWDGKQWIPQ
jgi:hypothetical protein